MPKQSWCKSSLINDPNYWQIMSKNSLHLSLTNNLSELDQLQSDLSRFGVNNGLNKKVIFQLTLVTEELFTNIITYGYEDAKEHRIIFSLSCEDNEVRIQVEDDALPFNLLEAQSPDFENGIEDRQIGGLGIHLTRKLMDEITYERKDNKNLITLRKKIDVLPEDDQQA